ncbi:MAG: DUF4266 domain-containing protein [Myxococcales bacterium]|nr:DUF4266 domain-containing protein [Myxococcales bacterium]
MSLAEDPALGQAARMHVRAVFTAVALAALAGGSTACVTVAPHQRALLAQPEMNPASDALEESFHSHIESAREGAFGGHGASGGGCGCG